MRALRLILFVVSFATNGLCQQPVKVTLCKLANDPVEYNHKLIEVTAFASHAFEDFSLFEPTCSAKNSVWLEYGGRVASGTTYCCGPTNVRTRRKSLVIEKIPIPLVQDDSFREFDRLIHRFNSSVVHATIVGRFFAGNQPKNPNAVTQPGYGHMGFFTLLAIQQIISVDPQDREDLYYGGPDDELNFDWKVGCGYRILESDKALDAQRDADGGQRSWAFDDPKRVALEALAHLQQIDEKSIVGLKETRREQGRFTYIWHPEGKTMSYMVLVRRPYWLSFYARDPKRVAWVVVDAYELTCGEGNATKR